MVSFVSQRCPNGCWDMTRLFECKNSFFNIQTSYLDQVLELETPFLALNGQEEYKKGHGSIFFRSSFLVDFWVISKAKKTLFFQNLGINRPKIGYKWKLQKSAPKTFSLLLWATHSQKTGILSLVEETNIHFGVKNPFFLRFSYKNKTKHVKMCAQYLILAR